MKNNCYKKTLVLGIIVLFICMSITPSTGNMTFFDDTTPPVTTIFLDPPEPTGENGWYISDVDVTLNATDDISGVKEIRYEINSGVQQVIPGSTGTFVIHDDGEDIHVEYWAIDNAGNIEPKNDLYIDMDQTEPEIYLEYEITGGNPQQGWDLLFTATATDETSGMNRVEFYLNDELQDTVYGPGPDYKWEFHYPVPLNTFNVRGLICNLEITDENVRFYAIIVKISRHYLHQIVIYACAYDNAGNWEKEYTREPIIPVSITSGIYLFQSLILPNNYTGYIGRFYIDAIFDDS